MNLSLLQNYDLLISQVLYLSTGMCVFLDRMWFSLFSLDRIMEVLALFCTSRQTVTTAAVHLNAQYVYLSQTMGHSPPVTAHGSMQGESASTHIIKFMCHSQSRQELTGLISLVIIGCVEFTSLSNLLFCMFITFSVRN